MAAEGRGSNRAQGRVALGEEAAGPASGTEAGSATQAAHIRALSESVSVGSIMTRGPLCVAPEASIAAATELFLDRDISAAPMVDEHFVPLGVISKTDLLRFWSHADRAESDEPSAAAAPGAEGQAAQASAPAGRLRLGALSRASGQAPPGEAAGPQVGAITKPYVLSLHEEAPISVAAALMAYESVHRLPIVSSEGDVIGVVSTLDIVRWLAETTGMGAG